MAFFQEEFARFEIFRVVNLPLLCRPWLCNMLLLRKD
jgi:hypothetical protein